MLSHEIKAIVEQASVSLIIGRGRGSLITGSLILAAAHCVPRECYGGATTLDDELGIISYPHPIGSNPMNIETPNGDVIATKPFAVEPVADVAVLGAPDARADCTQSNRFYVAHVPYVLLQVWQKSGNAITPSSQPMKRFD